MTDAARFAQLTVRLARAVTSLERDRVCCGDLSFQQFETLRLLGRGGPHGVGSVAEALGIDMSTASRNLQVLERGGYVVRRRGEDDARRVDLALTRKGAATLDSLCCGEDDAFSDLYRRLPAARRTIVAEALGLVLDAITSAAPRCCPAPIPQQRSTP